MIMHDFLNNIRGKAAKINSAIVFPEALDHRVLQAVDFLHNNNILSPILIGSQPDIMQAASSCGANISNIQIRDPLHDVEFQNYVNQLVQLRQHKGMTQEEATELMKDPVFFGTMMIKNGLADGLVSGAAHSTANTLRPALQILKAKEGYKLVSSFFFMVFQDRILIFSDCALNINPTSEELAEIAKASAESARKFEIEPKVALLSFSTKGSAKNELADKVIKAVQTMSSSNLNFAFDGEMQADTAIVQEVAASKAPDSPIKGDANVLVFPDLNSGNISYKLVERLAGASAIGPIIQGLNGAVNDLSRGCSVEDIINVAAITSIQSQEFKQSKPDQNPQPQQQSKEQSSQQTQQEGQQPQNPQPSQEQPLTVPDNQAPPLNNSENLSPDQILSDVKKLAERSSHTEKP